MCKYVYRSYDKIEYGDGLASESLIIYSYLKYGSHEFEILTALVRFDVLL